MDVDNIDLGIDFVEAIATSVGSCEVLIAVIGKRWLVSSDEEGRRRLRSRPPGSFRSLIKGIATIALKPTM